MRRLLLVVSLLAALYVAGYAALRGPVRGPADPPQTLIVAPGSSGAEVARQIHALGLVPHPALFRGLVALRGDSGRLRAGEYELAGPLSLDQIVDMLVKGEVVRHEVTFPEGRTIEDMAELAAARGVPPAAFREAALHVELIADLDPKASDLEGYLFPDTYELPRRPDPAGALVARQVQRFREVAAPLLPRLSAARLSVRELVTLASIVEMETGQALERPRIAAVFLNRLRIGMPLQTDPTVIFALRRAGAWDGNIRKADLSIDSPYNTYKHPGLPPGPIASPGRAALLAVLEPADTKDLYFVSRNDGTHQFSATLAEHERAVTQYQRRRRAS